VQLSDVGDLLAHQDGVVSRRQLARAGARTHDVERWVRRHELTRVHPGVYVVHNGPLTPRQRAWAAVLWGEPAALHLTSALGWRDRGHPVDIAIDARRRIVPPPGIRVHRVRGLGGRVIWSASPPRVRVEYALLELAHRAPREVDVIRVLTDGIGDRLTTATRLSRSLSERSRMRRRRWVERLLDDLGTGACSVLEHGYLTRVERAHGLPRASRQRTRRRATGTEFRDVEYDEYGLVVELDGRAAHESWDASGRDADRDLDDRADGKESVRLRYVQVFDRPCRTANRLERILRRRGWSDEAELCGPACSLRQS
jgi:hypothetical protein